MTRDLPLSSLRYFEQRLQATEESYREEIALLQLRMVESALEESLNKTAHDRYFSRFLSRQETCTEILHTVLFVTSVPFSLQFHFS